MLNAADQGPFPGFTYNKHSTFYGSLKEYEKGPRKRNGKRQVKPWNGASEKCNTGRTVVFWCLS